MSTNDPSHPSEVLICKGTILEGLHIDQRSLNIGRISRSSAGVTKTVEITRGDAGPIHPKLLPMTDKTIDVALNEIEAGEKYELVVTLKPPFNRDTIRTKVQIETGVVEDPSVVIPVYAAIMPRVAARPSRVIIPARANAHWKQSIRLTWDAPGPHKILSASITDPSIVAQVNESGGTHEVLLTLASAAVPASGAYMLTIKTDDAKMPEVKVPVSIGRKPGVRKNLKGTHSKAGRKPSLNLPQSKSRGAKSPATGAARGAVHVTPDKAAGG